MLSNLGKYLVRSGVSFPPRNLLHRYLAWSQLGDTLKDLKIDCVLDVGANRGQFATNLRKIGYRGRIHSFEPSPDDFASLSRALGHDRLWKGHNIALGPEDTVRTFHLHVQDTGWNSFLRMREPAGDLRDVPVQMRRLDSVFDELLDGMDNPHVFLKMDTQGFDLEVIKGAAGCLDRTLGLLSEIAVQPSYDGMPLYLDSLKTYQDLGFRLMGVAELNRAQGLGALVEMECLMVR